MGPCRVVPGHSSGGCAGLDLDQIVTSFPTSVGVVRLLRAFGLSLRAGLYHVIVEA